jgi:hypothetical protein
MVMVDVVSRAESASADGANAALPGDHQFDIASTNPVPGNKVIVACAAVYPFLGLAATFVVMFLAVVAIAGPIPAMPWELILRLDVVTVRAPAESLRNGAGITNLQTLLALALSVTSGANLREAHLAVGSQAVCPAAILTEVRRLLRYTTPIALLNCKLYL